MQQALALGAGNSVGKFAGGQAQLQRFGKGHGPCPFGKCRFRRLWRRPRSQRQPEADDKHCQ
jgi:hypothetical protein